MQTLKDKFAAIHYASFRGNIEICESLLNNGADSALIN
jgi:ankyrin repeat protein